MDDLAMALRSYYDSKHPRTIGGIPLSDVTDEQLRQFAKRSGVPVSPSDTREDLIERIESNYLQVRVVG
jgi:hypothetical protein